MSERAQHKFQFTAQQIADAALAEAEYHEKRLKHWQERSDKALKTVQKTVKAKVTKQEVTSSTRAGVIVEYGDPAAWQEYQLAYEKVRTHREATERFLTDKRLYYTQGDRVYELDSDDVHHFRLGGQERES